MHETYRHGYTNNQKENGMKKSHKKALQELRADGYAVVVFTPVELRGVSPDIVEDVLVQRGWDMIPDCDCERCPTCGGGLGDCPNQDDCYCAEEVG